MASRVINMKPITCIYFSLAWIINFSFKDVIDIKCCVHNKQHIHFQRLQGDLRKRPIHGQSFSITTEKLCNPLYSACKTITLNVNGDCVVVTLSTNRSVFWPNWASNTRRHFLSLVLFARWIQDNTDALQILAIRVLLI